MRIARFLAAVSLFLATPTCSRTDRVVPHEAEHAAAPLPGKHADAPSPAAPKVAKQAASRSAPVQDAAPSMAHPSAVPSAPHATDSALTRFDVVLRGDHVELSWTAPKEVALVRVLRRLHAPVADARDPQAHLVYEGPASSAIHPALELSVDPSAVEPAGTEYHYAAFACTTHDECEGVPRRAKIYPQLADALRKGGYVLYFRHATAEVCDDVEPLGKANNTTHPGWWKSCERDCPKATARQLSDRGVAEAKQLGAELRRLKVPVGRIMTSEFCRARDTARLMELRAHGKPIAIESAKVLTSFVYDEENRCADTYKLLAVAPSRGTNTVLVGHKGTTCPVVGSLNSAGVAIFRPAGPDGPSSIAVLDAADWAHY